MCGDSLQECLESSGGTNGETSSTPGEEAKAANSASADAKAAWPSVPKDCERELTEKGLTCARREDSPTLDGHSAATATLPPLNYTPPDAERPAPSQPRLPTNLTRPSPLRSEAPQRGLETLSLSFRGHGAVGTSRFGGDANCGLFLSVFHSHCMVAREAASTLLSVA